MCLALRCYATSNINVLLVLATELKPIAPDCTAVDRRRRKVVAGPSVIVWEYNRGTYSLVLKCRVT